MKKRKQIFAILLVVMSILLLACSKVDTIICGNCSANNPSENQYCSNCGTAFVQNSTTSPTEVTETNIPSESTEATTDNSIQSTEPPTTQPTQPEKPVQQKPSTNTHTHNYSAATCTSPKTCSCGATSGSSLGHSWSDATCTSPKKCSRCGATTGSAASHSYTQKDTAATCTAEGYTTYTCSACGDTYKDNYKDASHKYKDYKCTSCGTVDKAHAYEYLVAWVKQNGTADGAYTIFKYTTDDNTYELQYSAQYDSLSVNLSYDSGGTFAFSSIYLDTYFYGATVSNNCEVTGYLEPASFNENSSISYINYTGPSNSKNTTIEFARLSCCAMLDWLEWCLSYYEYQIGLTVADLGFTSW